MTKHKSKSNTALAKMRKRNATLDKLQRKRSTVIKAVAEANAAFDAHLKIWKRPGLLAKLDEGERAAALVAAMNAHEELEYDLAIAINELCYFDVEVATDELGSRQTIMRIEAEWAARKKIAKKEPT